MTLRAWINDKLPTWAWNLKNRLAGNPYRERVDKFERVPGVNYSLDTNGANAQGFFVKDGPVKPSKWFDDGAKEAIKRVERGDPPFGIHKIVYRDPQGNVTETTPSSASGE